MNTGKRGGWGHAIPPMIWAFLAVLVVLTPSSALAEANILVVEDDGTIFEPAEPCLLYTSDAADE